MASDKARSLEPCWVGVRAGIAVEIAPVHPGVTGLEEDEESESGYNQREDVFGKIERVRATDRYRGVAQSGSASALGAEGRGFESLRPDQYQLIETEPLRPYSF
jgi:hypothetical protein